MYKLDPVSSKDHGPCECCGSMSRTVTGFILGEQKCAAGFVVIWTLGEVPRHGAEIYLALGDWEGDATPADRFAVAVHFTWVAGRQSCFTVVDATGTSIDNGSLASRMMARSDVIGTPLAPHVFELIDFLWLADQRIAEIVESDYLIAECPHCEGLEEEWEDNEAEPDFSDIPDFGKPTTDMPKDSGVTKPEFIAYWISGVLILLVGLWQFAQAQHTSIANRIAVIAFLSLIPFALGCVTQHYKKNRREPSSQEAADEGRKD